MKIFTIAFLALSMNVCAQTPSFLNANASAQPDNVCAGNSVQLSAIVTGGSQSYTYTWSSVPEGFSSDLAEPVVAPQVSTVYYVEVNDGSTTETGSVTVIVRPVPLISLIPEDAVGIEITGPDEISTCPFNSVKLDAGNPGSTFLWSNGSTNQTILAQTSGISSDYQEFSVVVTDPETSCSNTKFISVNFDYAFCSYGIEDENINKGLMFYPNPSDGIFYLQSDVYKEQVAVEICTATGAFVKRAFVSSVTGNESNSLNLYDQPSGVYFVKITDNRITKMQKLIIQHK